MRTLDPVRMVQVPKASGCEFLRVAGETWRSKSILVIRDNPSLSVRPHHTEDLEAGGGWWEGEFIADHSEFLAQISSTSGTTGKPKAIAISRRAISDTVDRLVRHMELGPEIREYIGVPVTFSFGLGRARAVAAVGGAAFLPESGFRPDEIALMLRKGEINALSAVPTMLRTVLDCPETIGDAGRKLRWLEIGSQYMTAEEKRAVRKLFPEAAILQHYGLTEASRSTFLRIDQADDAQLESVGRTVDAGAVRIGAAGHIEVRGPHLASGVACGTELHPLTDSADWLRTSDLGELRDGWLHYLGRADDVANIGGVKVSVEAFERALAHQLDSHDPVAACIIRDRLRGEKLAVATLPGHLDRVTRTARAVAIEHGLKPADIALAEVSEFPRTATGKIQRNLLADRIEREASAEEISRDTAIPATEDMSERETQIASIWADALGVAAVRRDDSFYDLGGDSLSAVSVMIRAEQLRLPSEIMQRMFAGETVAQIAAALDGDPQHVRANLRSIRADALNAVRGLFALLIVVSHWGPFFVEKMGAPGAAIWSIAGPLLRIGTPGFAMVYGMGLGLFFFGQIEHGRDRLRRRIRTNTRLLIVGVLLVAAAQAWSLQATGAGFGPIWPEQLFYGVLLFYALMVPTSLFWLRRIAAAKDGIFASLLFWRRGLTPSIRRLSR